MLQATEEMIGQQALCPVCQSVQVVPAEDQGLLQTALPASKTESAAPPPPEKTRPRRRDDEEDDEDRPRSRRFRTNVRLREGSLPVVPLSGRAITAVILGVLSFLGLLITGIPAMLLGYLAMRDVSRNPGKRSGWGLGLTGLILGAVCTFLYTPCIGVGLIWPLYSLVSEFSDQKTATENLKEVGRAMLAYHGRNNHFPGAAVQNKKGESLLSWRVALLPYLGEDDLYAQFRLDEPWDSASNLPLVQKMPRVYTHPLDRAANRAGLTYFQVCVGPQTVFEKPQGHAMVEITDGTANTAMVLEAARPVTWTKPEDLTFNPAGPLPPVGGRFQRGFYVLMCDGSVHRLDSTFASRTLHLMITRNDGIRFTLPQ